MATNQDDRRQRAERPRVSRLAGLVDSRLDTDQLIGFLAGVLSTLPIGVAIAEVSEGWPVVYCNPRFERWAPRDRLPVTGNRLADVVPAAAANGLLAILDEVARTGVAQHFRAHRLTGIADVDMALEGGVSVWNWDVYPVRDAEGNVTHILQTALDVTAEVAAREREIADLREQTERLAALDKLRSDFLHLASHELRSPLSVVHAYLSLIDDGHGGELTPELRALLEPAMSNLEVMTALVDELVETARLEDPSLHLRRQEVDLADLIESAAAAVQYDQQHELKVTFGEGADRLAGDLTSLLRVVTNLIDNAVKYSPGGGTVEVIAEGDTDEVRIIVRDSGIGIAAEDIGRLFARFSRISTEATAEIPGTGLGLYLCREIVRRHGGDIGVVSEEGKGTTFTVHLPRDGVAAPEEPLAMVDAASA